MSKPKVGVYRTVYPLYSETFIAEQIRAYSQYQPVLICRELVRDVEDLDVVTIGNKRRFLKKVGFSAFGFSDVFDNFSALKNVRLIHAHFAQGAVLALPLARKLNVPLVVTCHGADVTVSDKYLAASMMLTNFRYLASRGKLMREASAFIAVSDFLRNAMIQRGFPAEKVVRHYIGVDTVRFVPRKGMLHQKSEAQFILSIARHTDVKGIDLLLKAFARVVRLHPYLRLVQIGGGALTTKLKTLVVQLGIEENVNFLGPQSPVEVLPYLQSCAALVLSSRQSKTGAEEAFGLVLSEASACGVPCIGTRVGGIPEAVVHGETGFIVEPENVEDIAEKISVLVSDRDLANAMGRRGREMVCDLFDIRNQTKKLEALYVQLS